MKPDPIAWLERLLEVSAGSEFTAQQKITIAARLRQTMQDLGASVPSIR